jgi:hypothetical protein
MEGLRHRYKSFGWDYFELLYWRRFKKVRSKHKNSFSKRARAREKEQLREYLNQ